MDKNDEFMDLLFLHYIKNDLSYLAKAKKIAPYTDFKGWPDDKEMFWDAESIVWKLKVEKALKELITKTILPYVSKNNLSLGSGSEPYVDSKLYIDISSKMLERIKGKTLKLDLDQDELPLGRFDSITCIFLLNYLKNYEKLIKNVKQRLNKDAYFIVVNSTVANNYKHLQNKKFSITTLKKVLKTNFSVEHKQKKFSNKTIDFFFCKKKS